MSHEKRTTHWYTVITLLLETLRQSLINITSFKLLLSLYFLSILFKCTNNLCSFFFLNILDRRIYETKFPIC
jgi:hypothetical protein